MAVKTYITQENIESILLAYDRGSLLQFNPIHQGTVQTNYRIQTTAGEFILRYYENRSRDSVLFESELLTHLNSKELPSPLPVRNKQGESVGSHKGKPYILFKFIEGQHVKHLTQSHKRQIIQNVANLHIMTRNFHSAFQEARWNYSTALCRDLVVSTALGIKTTDAYKKLAWVEQQLKTLDLPDELPKGICHCDFHFSNTLFLNDCLVGLIDFDDANYTFLTFDLVCLIDSWAWIFPSESLNWDQTRQIVQAYQEYRPLSDLEYRHLYDMHKFCILFDCIWFFDRGSANDFCERRKMVYLDTLGRDRYRQALFS